MANAKPDGTTLMVATSALNIQYITGNAQVNPMTDLTLIACLEDNGFSTLAVPRMLPTMTSMDLWSTQRLTPTS